MPDLSLFCPLCDLLHITLNELLAGEFIPDENLKEKSNQLLLEVVTSLLGEDRWENQTDSSASSVLKIKNIRKVYETESTVTEAVKDVSFEITQGSFVGIMGASGSGKTTSMEKYGNKDLDNAPAHHTTADGTDLFADHVIPDQYCQHPVGSFHRNVAESLFHLLIGKGNLPPSAA